MRRHLTADKFQVRILNEGSREYKIYFPCGDDGLQTPTLNVHIRAWRDKEKRPFPPADLKPKRVGVYSHGRSPIRNDAYELHCTGVNWAQVVLMDDRSIAGKIPEQEQFLVVGIGCTIYTKDGKLIIARRAGPDKVKQCPNRWHVVGGYADIESTIQTESLIPTVYKELKEEAGIYREDINMLIPVGAYESTMPGVSGIHVGFFARVLLTAKEVLERAKTAEDAHEGSLFAFSPENVQEMLDPDTFVPTAAASLVRIINTEPWRNFSCTRCRQAVAPKLARYRLIITRHGETDWNKENICVGSKDIPLNDAGRRQAREHTKKLADASIPINSIISSPLSRARETAFIIGEILEINDLTIDDRLRERCVGVREGLPDLKEWWKFFETEFLPEDAEPYPEFQNRVGAILIDISLMPRNVLTVTHALVMIEIIKQIRAWSPERLAQLGVPSHTEELIFAFGGRCSCGNLWFEQL